jgi:tetratricopeptide (TPR) repeat protein
VEEVLVDPDKLLPMIERPVPSKPAPTQLRTREGIAQALSGESVVSLIEEAMGGYGPEDCKKVVAYFDRAVEEKMKDQRGWLLLGVALYDTKRYKDALVAFEQMAEAHGPRCGNALVWQGHIQDLLGNREAAIECYRAAIRVGVPPLQHGQYGINMSRAYAEHYLSRPYVRRGR